VRAKRLSDLLKAGDRVAVSNIMGREAGAVTVASQRYCGNVVGGWALGKGGQALQVPGGEPIPVFGTVEELMSGLPKEKLPNKVIASSPPSAVYGEVKEVVQYGKDCVETIFIITEHVSIEVTAKIARLCTEADIDVVGCNTLGMVDAHDGVRVGAVGGENPSESFRAGSVALFCNSGNMVNTMASYLQSAGVGTSYGISTGKDVLILTPVRRLLELARDDERTRLIVLYVEPGGLYEQDAVRMLRSTDYAKPIIAYVTGDVLGTRDLSLGHAGAVVEGGATTAAAKMKLFDDYFGIEPFDPDGAYRKSPELVAALGRGIRITALHHLPAAAELILSKLGLQRDFRAGKPLRLNPWFTGLKPLARKLPAELLPHPGTIPQPYAAQLAQAGAAALGGQPARRSMRNARHASTTARWRPRWTGAPSPAPSCWPGRARSRSTTSRSSCWRGA